MSGPLGTSGGGAAGVTSVTAGNGITVTGTTTPTIAASLAAGTGIGISGTTTLTVSATGVNSVSAGTGISVSGTTALTVSATGVNSVSAGTGISVSGSTSLTVTNTGVTSLAGTGVSVSASTGAVTITAPVVAGGTGISVSGSQTTSLSITNSGVTSLVAGTNVSVSGATGAVTVNAPAFGTTITASTIGGTAAAGTSTSVAREDHKHAFPAGAAPASLLVASTQATGTSTAPALADHVHAMPGAAAAGASAVGDTAATGSATTLALSDHRHSREAFGTPIVVNGQTTSLATGSLTTLARADHVHTVSNVMVLIGSVSVSTRTASFTLSSIPQTYKGLYIYAAIMGVSSGNSTNALSAQFNGDTGANYYSGNTSSFRTDAYLGLCALTGNFVNANAMITNNIADYASTTQKKMTYGFGPYNGSTSANLLGTAAYYNYWNNTAAITSIKFFITDGYDFEVGSHIRLFGYP